MVFMILLAALTLGFPIHAGVLFENDVHSSFGAAICGIGDANGDGHADLLVSDGGHRWNAKEAISEDEVGRVWLISGKDHATLWSVEGERVADGFGRRLARLADLNGDGVDDCVVSTNDLRPDARGYVTILCGQTGSVIRKLEGAEAGECFGYTASGVGDLDADGLEDLAIYSEQQDASGSRWVSLLCVSGLDDSPLFRVTKSEERGEVGYKPFGIGDADGDGHDDFVISRYRDTAWWLEAVSGRDGSALWSRRGVGRWHRSDSAAHRGAGGELQIPIAHGKHLKLLSPADGSVTSVRGSLPRSGLLALDDVDGDGYTDVLMSDLNWQVATGMARLLSGEDGRTLYAVHSAAPDTWKFGAKMASAGDMNGDGVADFAVAGDHVTSGSRGKLWLFSGLDGYSLGVFMREGDTVVPYAD
jgi:hypothetical protein